MGQVLKFFILVALLMNVGCTSGVMKTVGNLTSIKAPPPIGAEVEIKEVLKSGDVEIEITGMAVIMVKIFDHGVGYVPPKEILNSSTFIIKRGQGFKFWFDCDKPVLCRPGFKGQEYLWSGSTCLGKGLVALPTVETTAEIFVKKHLTQELQEKVRLENIISPLR